MFKVFFNYMLCVPIHVYVHVNEGAYRPQEGTASPAPGVTVMLPQVDAGSQSALCTSAAMLFPVGHVAPALCAVVDKGKLLLVLPKLR